MIKLLIAVDYTTAITRFNIAAAKVPTAIPKSFLASLPAELLAGIIQYLDPIQSVCVGLTCKAFYEIHWKIHGKVGLFELPSRLGNYSLISPLLREFVSPWMKKAGYHFSYSKRKFLRYNSREVVVRA
jgi:hypothetical protein